VLNSSDLFRPSCSRGSASLQPLGKAAKVPAAAKALIEFLTTPAAMAVMKANGWDLIP
jgi:hypothetical protein